MQVLVLKSDQLYGHVLKKTVERMFAGAEVSVFRLAREALRALRLAPFALALLDTQTEDIDGLDHIPAVIRSGLARQTLVLLGRSDARTVAELRRLQCDAMVDADGADIAELQHALGEIAARRHYVSGSLVRRQIRNLTAFNLHLLTPHEELALSLLGEGFDDGEVAVRLGCSPDTVRTHRAHIMRKLDLHQKGELMRYAIGQSYVRFSSTGILHPGFEYRLSECRKSRDLDLAPLGLLSLPQQQPREGAGMSEQKLASWGETREGRAG
jgi:two-component system nitrate/nitrite response regulator NarL